jgi:UPF0755 protein
MKSIRIIIAVLTLLAVAAAVYAYSMWQSIQQPVEHEYAREAIEVPRGSSLDSTLNVLKAKGLIKDPLAVKLYIKLNGKASEIKAGDYYFPTPITPAQILKMLAEGGQGADKLTVVEGWNRWDIASAMSHIPILKLKDSNAALKLMDNTTLIKDLDPSAKNLEGFLFPETYPIFLTTTPDDMVKGMVKQFRTVWTSKLAEDAKSWHRSVHDVVTVASIIETEAKLKDERPVIASVIYNRLQKGMTLSMDSTIVYASKLAGKWRNDGKVYQSDIDRDSPYNTRKRLGLPAGPVGSPGLSSLEAAINPARTDFLFYVRNPDRNDGAHNFYTNAADFETGVNALREWEKRQQSASSRH